MLEIVEFVGGCVGLVWLWVMHGIMEHIFFEHAAI